MNGALQELLLNIILGILTIIGCYIISYIDKCISKLRAEKDKIKNEDARNMATAAIDRVDSLAKETVLAIEGQTAKTLREAVKRGEAPRDELCKLAQDAVDQIIYELTPNYEAALESSVSDIDQYVARIVEAKLEELKATGVVARATT